LIVAAVSANSALAATVGGTATNANVVVPTPVAAGAPLWTTLRMQPIPAAAWPRYCIATGSADAFRPTVLAGQNTYYFTVSNVPQPFPNQGQERTLMFLNQGSGVGDPVILDSPLKEITTTGGWMGGAMNNPGYFTFPAGVAGNIFFLARKAAPALPNLNVDDASLTVVCTTANELPLPSLFNPVPVP
jgi:hypothetical protein